MYNRTINYRVAVIFRQVTSKIHKLKYLIFILLNIYFYYIEFFAAPVVWGNCSYCSPPPAQSSLHARTHTDTDTHFCTCTIRPIGVFYCTELIDFDVTVSFTRIDISGHQTPDFQSGTTALDYQVTIFIFIKSTFTIIRPLGGRWMLTGCGR
ncbi:hypothetical protein QTP88_020185 [Uroleucon formosanum]